MPQVVTERTTDAAGAAALLRPRDDMVLERSLGSGRYDLVQGPFDHYQRTVVAEQLPGGRVHVTQTIDFRLAIPFFGFLFQLPVRRALARGLPPGRFPWWHAPDRIDSQAATALGCLCALAVVTGYLNTLLSQTITFAAEEFGASETAEGVVGAVVRLGGLLAFAVAALADRRGRRRLVLAAALAGCLVSATGAAAPSLPWLAASQLLGRSFATALLVLMPIVAAEEMPRNSRAYAISLLALSGGLGAGFCVLSLSLADLGVRGWRLVYLLPLLGVLLTLLVARRLPESRRFAATHVEVGLPGHGARLGLFAVALFLHNMFIAPSSFFGNDYLNDERGYSGARISMLTVLTGSPASIGVIVGGRLADLHGRKPVGAISLSVGTVLAVGYYFAYGWPLWALSLMSGIILAASIPALHVYSPEMFPTSLRGRAGGLIAMSGLVGSMVGLVLVGVLSDALDRFGPAMAVASLGNLMLAALVITRYPETAHRELEELNPEDQPAPR